ncbi:nuclear pore complex protein Nup54 [Schistosoma bovis]|uniref:Nuclear pore complex protein Nup54 n=1 Tax=Schistosoma bovis TaxID=6184 RepID=A0A430QBK8_SCHBO|nr:nuclear pore complex protein Nup54 [Schistosoma bovis]
MSLFGSPKLFGFSQPTTSAVSAAPTLGFGLQPSLASTTTPFGNFGLGSTVSTMSSGLFQAAAAKTTNTTFPGFGQNSTPFQGFNLNTPKTSTGLFGSTFSAPTTSTQMGLNLFGSQFGQQASQNTGFSFTQPTQSLFNIPKTQGFGFDQSLPVTAQQQQQQQLQVAQQNTVDAFFASLSQPMLFGDERDSVIARWNQLQAMWGTGIGYSAVGMVNYTPENTFARLKSIGYNVLPTSTDADGLVCLYIGRPFSEVTNQRQAVQDILFRLLGGRPNLQLMVEEIRPCAEAEDSTEVILKVVERLATGTTSTISATELAKYLSSPSVAPQLQSQLCVNRLIPEISPSAAQIVAYNENPPAGFDRLIWQQACLDNPHPDRMIPIPFIGFPDLKRRKCDQLAYGEQQSSMIKYITELVSKLRTGQLVMSQRLIQLKRKQIELSHRVLKVLKHQEVHRRCGFAISVEEEGMRCELERIWSELVAPRGLRIRFQEALSTLRNSSEFNKRDKENVGSVYKGVHSLESGDGYPSTWSLDPDSLNELKEYLTQRHNGIREMQRLITEMTNNLKVMEDNPITNINPSVHKSPFVNSPPIGGVHKVSFAVNSRIVH